MKEFSNIRKFRYWHTCITKNGSKLGEPVRATWACQWSTGFSGKYIKYANSVEKETQTDLVENRKSPDRTVKVWRLSESTTELGNLQKHKINTKETHFGAMKLNEKWKTKMPVFTRTSGIRWISCGALRPQPSPMTVPLHLPLYGYWIGMQRQRSPPKWALYRNWWWLGRGRAESPALTGRPTTPHSERYWPHWLNGCRHRDRCSSQCRWPSWLRRHRHRHPYIAAVAAYKTQSRQRSKRRLSHFPPS